MNSRQDRPVMVRFSDVINASNSLQRIGSDRIQRKRVETRALILYLTTAGDVLIARFADV